MSDYGRLDSRALDDFIEGKYDINNPANHTDIIDEFPDVFDEIYVGGWLPEFILDTPETYDKLSEALYIITDKMIRKLIIKEKPYREVYTKRELAEFQKIHAKEIAYKFKVKARVIIKQYMDSLVGKQALVYYKGGRIKCTIDSYLGGATGGAIGITLKSGVKYKFHMNFIKKINKHLNGKNDC